MRWWHALPVWGLLLWALGPQMSALAQAEGGGAPAAPTAPATAAPAGDGGIFALDSGSALLQREYDLTRKMSPIPSDIGTYQIRRGDTLSVHVITGEPEDIDVVALVDYSGTVKLPWIEPVPVLGQTVAQASELLTTAYAQIYLRAFAQVTLKQLGAFQVVVAGYHRFPGLYRVYNGTSLYALLLALDLEINGLSRDLTLERSTQEVAPGTMPDFTPEQMAVLGAFDPFDFSVGGHFERDLFLEPWDRLTIGEPTVIVTLDRGVSRPGRYSVLPGEALLDILEIAGEVDPTADLRNTTLTRYDETGTPLFMYVDLAEALATEAAIPLQHQDRINIVAYVNQVFVLGEVNLPGPYPLYPGQGILEAIGQAGGLTPEAHAKFISIVRPPRLFKDRLEQNEVQVVDIRDYTEGRPDPEKLQLRPGDIIYVPDKGAEVNSLGLLSSALTALGIVLR